MTENIDDVITTGTLNPNVKLPPAALRLESLDLDPTGNPYYKFPPFLSPPDGVELIPFEKFKAHGIQICLESDVEELDGEGIPTVALGTKHGAPGDKEKKRKKRKSKKEGDETKKGSPWWDDWAEGEDLRRADNYDPNTPRIDRFAQGATEFQQNRKWTPALQSLYDHFRHYTGLLAHATKRHRFGKGEGMEEVNDEEDDEAELTAEQMKEEATETNPFPEPVIDVDADEEEPKIQEVDADFQQRYEEEQEAKEMRMDAFLNDPGKSMKVFFSSFYKDKGLFWSESKLRDGPILLSFFLGFFIRNKIMPDYEKAFRKAYKITEQARLELPQTTKISMAIPDTFGSACTALWGSNMPQAWQGKNAMDIDEGGTWSKSAPGPVSDWEAQLKEKGVEKIDIDVAATVQAESTGWGAPIEGFESTGAGGTWGDGATVVQNETDPWSAPGGTGVWGTSEETPSLLSILGPTTLPLTHDVQLVEKSTRQIVSITPPNPDIKGLGHVLGTVIVAPWKDPKEGSSVVPPELLTDLPEDSTFDMARTMIKVFVEPKTLEVLKDGMGLHAVFVQVIETAANKAESKEKKSKSRSKGKSKAKGSDDKEWWYIEFLYEVLPSFWTEEGD